MCLPEGDEEVDSLATTYDATYYSGEMMELLLLLGVCWANVCRMRIVSGKASSGRLGGRVPRSKSSDEGVSPRQPNRSAIGPEPKGVECAW